MIPLRLSAASDAERPFIIRLSNERRAGQCPSDAVRLFESEGETAFSSGSGFFTLHSDGQQLDGDVLLIEPGAGSATRIIRATSPHNSLLVTERCDQLCVMCSQPPKKTHVDRFGIFRDACVLAPQEALIGISGGEPTLYKSELLELVEHVLGVRPDLRFHILSNGQHFDMSDVERLSQPLYGNVSWGIPLYSADPADHDEIVGKAGAFERLEQSLHVLLLAGSTVELRTVVMLSTVKGLGALARHIAARLSFISSWSIMQLENTGFAKSRWGLLYFDHASDFAPVATALDLAQAHGIQARLFNFPFCTVPANYRHLAPASISDWKRKYAPACEGCRAMNQCSGFFEWHPEDALMQGVRPL
jgi:His-Xaa-Ser system radical SAM maturase HxsC